MKKITLLFLGILAVLVSVAQKTTQPIALIPQPVSMLQGNGVFVLTPNITCDNTPEIKRIAQRLATQIGSATGYKITVKSNKPAVAKAINLSLIKDASIPNEGYRLKVTTSGVSLTATTPAGLFYG